MTIPDNFTIQSALITKLKASTSVTAVVIAEEIREDQWQGTDFVYPNIRVKMTDNKPSEITCDRTNFICRFQVFSEDASSKEAEIIAGIIANVLHRSPFSSSSHQYTLTVTNLVPAVRMDDRTWRSEVLTTGIANG